MLIFSIILQYNYDHYCDKKWNDNIIELTNCFQSLHLPRWGNVVVTQKDQKGQQKSTGYNNPGDSNNGSNQRWHWSKPPLCTANKYIKTTWTSSRIIIIYNYTKCKLTSKYSQNIYGKRSSRYPISFENLFKIRPTV